MAGDRIPVSLRHTPARSCCPRIPARKTLDSPSPACRWPILKYYTAALVAQALGGSSHSRLFQEVREKRGLAYAVQARFDGMERAGLMRVYVGTSAERAHESVEVVMQELRKLETDGITEDELRLSKTRLKSQLVMRSESTSGSHGVQSTLLVV